MQVQVLNYLIESSIIFTILFLTYIGFFSGYKNFRFNRVFLLIAIGFSLSAPVLNLPFFLTVGNGNLSGIQQVIQLPEITITDRISAEESSSWQRPGLMLIIIVLYGAGVLAQMLRLFFRLYRIVHFIRKNKKHGVHQQFYTLIPTDGYISTCSFFDYLLWDNSQHYTKQEAALILKHEETHIRLKHSYDIMLSEFLIVFFWFNPVVYFYRSALAALHEFTADDNAASLTTRSEYISLLSYKTLKSLQLTLGNNFHYTQIFKRMNMLKSEKRRSWWSRIALTVPVFAILFYLFACERDYESSRQLESNISLPEGMYRVELDEVSPKVADWYRKGISEVTEDYTSRNINNIEVFAVRVDMKKVKNFPMKGSNIRFHQVWVDKENEKDFMYAVAIHSDDFVAENDIDMRSAQDEVFTVVEEVPEPMEGGMPALYGYIMKNMQYPKQAREQGIEGKVYVEFVVNKDGTVSDVNVVKGIGGGCDEEAKRVVGNSPLWKPGKQRGVAVNVKMILPISFSLSGVGKSGSSGEAFKPEGKTAEEVVVVGY